MPRSKLHRVHWCRVIWQRAIVRPLLAGRPKPRKIKGGRGDYVSARLFATREEAETHSVDEVWCVVSDDTHIITCSWFRVE